jgi:UDP-2-acetamido-3-amino-2,3-dideoxy-glucuronate N-acetyltransferase
MFEPKVGVAPQAAARSQPASIHATAEVSPLAEIGAGTRIWHQVQIRERARIGENCIVGKGAYIDLDVEVGNNVKIQNSALLYHGLTVEDGVFIGPGAIMTNDVYPRAITPEGELKSDSDWTVGPIRICYGASIGAGAIILPNVTVGRFALVAAGAVVSRSVPEYGLVAGVPARLLGYACRCGRRMEPGPAGWYCSTCDWTYRPADGDK